MKSRNQLWNCPWVHIHSWIVILLKKWLHKRIDASDATILTNSKMVKQVHNFFVFCGRNSQWLWVLPNKNGGQVTQEGRERDFYFYCIFILFSFLSTTTHTAASSSLLKTYIFFHFEVSCCFWLVFPASRRRRVMSLLFSNEKKGHFFASCFFLYIERRSFLRCKRAAAAAESKKDENSSKYSFIDTRPCTHTPGCCCVRVGGQGKVFFFFFPVAKTWAERNRRIKAEQKEKTNDRRGRVAVVLHYKYRAIVSCWAWSCSSFNSRKKKLVSFASEQNSTR